MKVKALAPSNPKDRFDIYRFYNGIFAEEQKVEEKRIRTPLVKSFLLEHVSSNGETVPKTTESIFNPFGIQIKHLDDNFMTLADPAEGTFGFLERYNERFFAYYTCEDSQVAKRRVGSWVRSPDLDFTWFSGPLLQSLWDKDVSERGDEKFGKLVFRHESIYDMPEDFSADAAIDEEDENSSEDESESADEPEYERRKAKFEMGDSVGRIRKSLQSLQNNYSPLHALYALRLPSRYTKGGHDLYQTGQITNRTNSFEEHRNVVRYLYRIYASILNDTEASAWADQTTDHLAGSSIKGAPLIVRFSEPLTDSTFDHWIQMAFQKRNRFKLWGNPIRLGPGKVHVYGADRHLWQPINLEITKTQLVAILPQGTCGNTFHRLVSNIQHYVSPEISAWIGSTPFSEIVSKWPEGLEDINEG